MVICFEKQALVIPVSLAVVWKPKISKSEHYTIKILSRTSRPTSYVFHEGEESKKIDKKGFQVCQNRNLSNGG